MSSHGKPATAPLFTPAESLALSRDNKDDPIPPGARIDPDQMQEWVKCPNCPESSPRWMLTDGDICYLCYWRDYYAKKFASITNRIHRHINKHDSRRQAYCRAEWLQDWADRNPRIVGETHTVVIGAVGIDLFTATPAHARDVLHQYRKLVVCPKLMPEAISGHEITDDDINTILHTFGIITDKPDPDAEGLEDEGDLAGSGDEVDDDPEIV